MLPERLNKMSENKDFEKNDQQQDSEHPQTLGDYLRREREAKRITIDTIAKDLKLNAKYVKALEANQYDALPADPYVRVYLRSIAKYLLLDSEEILARFYKEQGLTPPKSHHETSTKLNISTVEPERKFGPGIIILVIVILLAGLSFFATRQGWIGGQELSPPEVISEDTTETVVPESDSIPQEETISDTADTSDTATEDTESEPEASTAPKVLDKLKLVVQVEKESSWIQVFADGESYKNTLRPGSRRTFTAKDSINVHVGNKSAVRFTLNGKRITSLTGSDVVVFKIDKTGSIDQWTLSKWQTVFADELN